MKESVSLSEIIDEVCRQFSDSPPNGWLLGWDESRCYELIHAAAAPCETTNNTSFDYNFCNLFISKATGRDECYWTLTVRLSFIVPAYSMHWTQYEKSGEAFVIQEAPNDYTQIESKIRAAIENAGFFELPRDWYEQELQGIELELSGTENVTLGKCLFQDYDG